jgi:hypothetical protein
MPPVNRALDAIINLRQALVDMNEADLAMAVLVGCDDLFWIYQRVAPSYSAFHRAFGAGDVARQAAQ